MKPVQTLKSIRKTLDRSNPEDLVFKAPVGLSEELVRQISCDKNEPAWMLKKRLEGFKAFNELSFPNWGPDISELDLREIHFYLKPRANKNSNSWDEVPKDIRDTYEKLGIPEAERKSLAGVGAQYESEVVYHKLKKELEEQGVVFLDMDEAVQKYPQLVEKYF